MEHKYNMDYAYNRTTRQHTTTSDSEVSTSPNLSDPNEKLPCIYKKFIVIRNFGSMSFFKSK